MRLVVLYGPPATGKLTVARELCRLTGLHLFHNHLTADLAASLFTYGSPEYMDYVQHLRREALERAARADVSLVFTFWYSSVSAPSIARYRGIIEEHGGTVLLVRLHCRPEVRDERVVSPSRQGWKLATVPELHAALERFPGSFDTMPGTHLKLDTSDLGPADAARQIARQLGL